MPVARSHRLPALLIPLIIAALAACGGSARTETATPAAVTPTTAANRVQTTQAVPIANTTAPGTPTPLANGLPTVTARATGAATTATSASTGTPTVTARTTATVGTNVTANTATSGVATARGTQISGSVTTSTRTSGSAITGTGAAGIPTTTPVPASEARGATEQFLRTVLAKGDISGYLTPALASQAGNDDYTLLAIQPPIREFTIDSEQRDADGNGATVGATITTASGVVKRTFVLRKQGSTWLIDSVSG